ncbi:hypothetical protein [Lonomia obliqua multiple nucleopolyhedrovirus]|uniref:Uncharacterized protein n=1 Tax=Lonomia obliqua multiple nucleopolyhedrovirus TaxID=134394 RepID=A0A126FC68_9ABAC|nr:hypothetical protein [Lonomia obliqua multiple nucleopolyhedrovirus]AKN80992.1 hypothetical protein [Lonomia obliqua multiple nucleopolyhedrovirus]
MWAQDLKNNGVDIEKPLLCHNSTSVVLCELCLSKSTPNDYWCCDKCLFPIVDDLNGQHKLTAKQQLYVFALLSICYWEEKLLTIENTYEKAAAGFRKEEKKDINNTYIWKQRLRITWSNIDRPFVCIIANTSVCVQCSLDNYESIKLHYNSIIETFDEKYFCQNCLFPLFDVLIFL